MKIILKLREAYNIPYVPGAESKSQDPDFRRDWLELKKVIPFLTLRPVFTVLPPDKLQALVKKATLIDLTYVPVNFEKYFYCDTPPDFNIQLLSVKALNRLFETVELQRELRVGSPVNPADDTYFGIQEHLKPAPMGIDAQAAWAEPGGDGGIIGELPPVRVIDLEFGFDLTHADLGMSAADLLHGANHAYILHGTNVLGVIGAVDNDKGCIGIAPNCKKYAVSGCDAAGREDTPNAILFAISHLDYGDVLLIELQAEGTLTPIEEFFHFRDIIRLGTALGVVIIALGGNGNNDLDAYTNYAGDTVFKPGSESFTDTGAILVGGVDSRPASTSAAGSRSAATYGGGGSNYGARIDCFARYNHIVTTGNSDYDSTPGAPPPLDPSYTSTFNGTSGASAIIAGAVVSIQSMLQAIGRRRYNSWQMRKLLRNESLGTRSADPPADRVGVMPDLRKIIASLKHDPYTDVYVRDHITDVGERFAGAISASPDVFILNGPAAAGVIAAGNQQALFGAGSGTEDRNDLGFTVRHDLDNYIYVRVKNRGTRDALQVSCRVYYAPVSSLVTPYNWELVGETIIPLVPAGDSLTVSNPIIWNSASPVPVPVSGHYCFVCIIGNADDPMPLLLRPEDVAITPPDPSADIVVYTWDNFYRLIRDNNNITWRNFNVADVPAMPAPVVFAFTLTGAPDKTGKFTLRIQHDLPRSTRIRLDLPATAVHLFTEAGIKLSQANESYAAAWQDTNLIIIRDLQLPEKFSATCKLGFLFDEPLPEPGQYRVSLTQLYHGQIIGRITWQLEIGGRPV